MAVFIPNTILLSFNSSSDSSQEYLIKTRDWLFIHSYGVDIVLITKFVRFN